MTGEEERRRREELDPQSPQREEAASSRDPGEDYGPGKGSASPALLLLPVDVGREGWIKGVFH